LNFPFSIPVIMAALMRRFANQGNSAYQNRALAKMRQAFGGHALRKSD